MSNDFDATRVFISYSHDSATHIDHVLELSDRLRGDGVDCWIDQYEESPREGWPKWMLNQIQQADIVIAICTENYKARFEGTAKPGIGKGVKWEGAIVTQQMYERETDGEKTIPVVFADDDVAHIPLVLCSFTHYSYIENGEGYEKLYRRLTSQHDVPAPRLGAVKDLPPRQRAHYESNPEAGSCTQVELEFDCPVEEFDEERLRIELAKLVGNEYGPIRVVLIKRGSTIVTLEGDAIAMTRLVRQLGTVSESSTEFARTLTLSGVVAIDMAVRRRVDLPNPQRAAKSANDGDWIMAAVAPSDPGAVWAVRIPVGLVESLRKVGLKYKFLQLSLVRSVLLNPSAVFQGYGRSDGFHDAFCFVGSPKNDVATQVDVRVPPPKNMVFVVFVTADGIVTEWRWEPESAENPEFPRDWQSRYKGEAVWKVS